MWKLAFLCLKHAGRETNAKIPVWSRFALWVLSVSAGKVLQPGEFCVCGSQAEHSSAWPCLASDKVKIKGSCIISSQHIATWQEQALRLLGAMMKSVTDKITSQPQRPSSWREPQPWNVTHAVPPPHVHRGNQTQGSVGDFGSLVSVIIGIQLSPSCLHLVWGQLKVKIVRVFIWEHSFILLPGKPQNVPCVCWPLHAKGFSQGGSQLAFFANGRCLCLVFSSWRKSYWVIETFSFVLSENWCAIFHLPAFRSEGLNY